MGTPFRRPPPPHASLDQQKKLAKELLRAFRAGEREAQARVRALLPDRPRVVLADAQYVLAREYGFASWSELKRHIEAESGAPRGAPFDAMRTALQNNDAATLRSLLERHAELRPMLNRPLFAFDSTALAHFAGRADVAVIDVLLEYGADPNIRSSWWAGGFHPLHSASGPVAERLLAAGAVPDACAAAHLDRPDLLAAMIAADPASVHERGGDGQTPLHFARSREVAELLLAAGADPDARDVDHRATPAQWMLDHRRGQGRYALAGWLVERGATADIFLAAALGLTGRVRAMLEADPSLLDLRTTQGEYGEKPPSSYHIYMWTIGADLSPLQVAARFEQQDTLEVMLAMASPRQRLLNALAQGDAGDAHALLRSHPDLLSTLRPEDRRALPDAGWSGNTRAVELMLELGFDLLVTSEAGASVLHMAAWEGVAECVAAILRHPAATELLNRREPAYGGTPLGWCCHGSVHSGNPQRDHAAIARMLLEAGAHPIDPGDASADVRAVIEEWRRRT